MSGGLDELLMAPLAEVADDGFSVRMLGRIAAKQRREEWLTSAMIALAALPLLFAIPSAATSMAIARLLPSLASAEPVAFAMAALVLTLSFETVIRER